MSHRIRTLATGAALVLTATLAPAPAHAATFSGSTKEKLWSAGLPSITGNHKLTSKVTVVNSRVRWHSLTVTRNYGLEACPIRDMRIRIYSGPPGDGQKVTDRTVPLVCSSLSEMRNQPHETHESMAYRFRPRIRRSVGTVLVTGTLRRDTPMGAPDTDFKIHYSFPASLS